MSKHYTPLYDWSWQVGRQIADPDDRAAVMRELDGHIEDRIEAYIEAGLSREEAETKAQAVMGDPEAIGKQLAALHKPWLNTLLRLSRAFCVVCLLLAYYIFGSGAIAADWYAPENVASLAETANLRAAESMRREHPDTVTLMPCDLWDADGYTFRLEDGYRLQKLLHAEITCSRRPLLPFPKGVFNELGFVDQDGRALDHTLRFADEDTALYTVKLEENTTQVTLRYAFGQAGFEAVLQEVQK